MVKYFIESILVYWISLAMIRSSVLVAIRKKNVPVYLGRKVEEQKILAFFPGKLINPRNPGRLGFKKFGIVQIGLEYFFLTKTVKECILKGLCTTIQYKNIEVRKL